MLEEILNKIDTDLDSSLARLVDFLQIKSISTDPNYKDDCNQAADYLVADLTSIGFEARACQTEGHPVVLGHYKSSNPDAKRVLFYGHYDVQPVDPIELWSSDPFAPQLVEKNGVQQIVARGSSDDKGQLMTFVEACRAYKAIEGDLPVNVTVLFEGEEESGSPSLDKFLNDYKDELQADIALICDTSMWDSETPAITVGLRGMLGEEIKILAANRDLHSGEYGGIAANPLRILSKICGDLHDETGKVTIPGFYDGVRELPEELVNIWRQLEQEADILGGIGLKYSSGETGRSLLESTWVRPTAEINGMTGGYTGSGFKTVIPAEASAKISFRLVGSQDPDAIRENFREFVKARVPEDCNVEFIDHGASKAVEVSEAAAGHFLTKARVALKEEWNKDALLIYSGGSIPIAGDFAEKFGISTLLIGFALDDDAIHSPNEKYNVTSFHKGQRSWVRILSSFGAVK